MGKKKRRVIEDDGEEKQLGRNELIARYIHRKTGVKRSRKQVRPSPDCPPLPLSRDDTDTCTRHHAHARTAGLIAHPGRAQARDAR